MNGSDDPQGDVVDGQLIVTGRQRPTPLEPTHHAFDDVAAPVRLSVEGLVARLILACGDYRLDMVPSQPVTHPGETVGLIGGGTLRPTFASSRTWSSRPVHDLLEALDLMPLPRSHPHGQEDAPAVTDQMRLSAETALRASQRMPLGLGHLHRLGPAQLRRWR